VFDLDAEGSDPVTRSRFLPAGVLEADGRLGAVDAGKITEHVRHSMYAESCAAGPAEGGTVPEPEKDGAYSWIKAPRYDGAPAEVGPLARVLVAYAQGHPLVKGEIDSVLSATGLGAEKLHSALGRHLARALEAKWVCDAMGEWVEQLAPGEVACADSAIPEEAAGVGLTEGPRGSLGHWIQIAEGKISRYQLVVPTTWNAGPRDAAGVPGPIEGALIGTPVKDAANPFEIVRIVRSFDPCLACAVHVVNARGRALGEYRIV